MHNKFDLGFFPTPLESLSNLSKKYSNYNLFIKRDDNSGLASGGNKVRKLEYLIFDALKKECDTILTAGAQQSNHCRQTAAACNKVGLKCHLLLGGNQPTNYSGNLLLSHILGANIHFVGNNRKGETIERVKNQLEEKGDKVYVIPYGGSNIIGALGFVNAAKELKEQLFEKDLNIDYIFFASSSGGTQVGLTLGIEKFNLKTNLMPISIDNKGFGNQTLEEAILNILKEGNNRLNLNRKYTFDDAKLIMGYDKSSYGVVTSNEKYAIKLLAQTEGILLDPVYSGRAFFGMLDFLNKNKISKKSNVLFWHTGGLPATFHHSDELSNL